MTANPHRLSLEPAAQAFVEAADVPPLSYELPPHEGRKALDEVQASEIFKPDIHEEWVTVDAVRVRIVRPLGADGALPVILYLHGAGWVFGDAFTHDRLVRDLAIGAHAAVVVPEYDRSPEARYPVAVEQSYAVAQWLAQRVPQRIARDGARDDAANLLDASRMAIAGDSAGGNLAAAVTLLAKERGDVAFVQQVLFYPVTNAAFGTLSYERFATGYHLTREGMKWFWDQYTTSEAQRAEPTASPLRASLEQLAGLPPALIITAEADVLCDEGEAYAARLRDAGVPVTAVRYCGIIHDFVMLNPLHETHAALAAISQATAVLRAELHDGSVAWPPDPIKTGSGW